MNDEFIEMSFTALKEYFAEVGCIIIDKGSGPVKVHLPYATTEWMVRIDYDGNVILNDYSWHSGISRKGRKEYRQVLSDPTCFQKLIAHMQKHSTFLRGGYNNEIPTIKAI